MDIVCWEEDGKFLFWMQQRLLCLPECGNGEWAPLEVFSSDSEEESVRWLSPKLEANGESSRIQTLLSD